MRPAVGQARTAHLPDAHARGARCGPMCHGKGEFSPPHRMHRTLPQLAAVRLVRWPPGPKRVTSDANDAVGPRRAEHERRARSCGCGGERSPIWSG